MPSSKPNWPSVHEFAHFVAAVFIVASLGGLQTAMGQGAALGVQSAAAAVPGVSLDAARKAHEAGEVVMIDIREGGEHATGVAKGALLLPMSQINQRLAEIPKMPDKPVLLICNTQNRSARVAAALHRAGYVHVSHVDGGMAEWAKRGWPMVKP